MQVPTDGVSVEPHEANERCGEIIRSGGAVHALEIVGMCSLEKVEAVFGSVERSPREPEVQW